MTPFDSIGQLPLLYFLNMIRTSLSHCAKDKKSKEGTKEQKLKRESPG